MMETTLLEPSIADALIAIEAAIDLPASKRRHWTCSLRQTCTYLNRPIELVPARWTAINYAVRDLHPSRVGASPKLSATTRATGGAAVVYRG